MSFFVFWNVLKLYHEISRFQAHVVEKGLETQAAMGSQGGAGRAGGLGGAGRAGADSVGSRNGVVSGAGVFVSNIENIIQQFFCLLEVAFKIHLAQKSRPPSLSMGIMPLSLVFLKNLNNEQEKEHKKVFK